jgi:hypothetical protein
VTIELTLEGEDLVVLLALVVLELALRAGSIAVRALRGQGSGTATRSDASG